MTIEEILFDQMKSPTIVFDKAKVAHLKDLLEKRNDWSALLDELMERAVRDLQWHLAQLPQPVKGYCYKHKVKAIRKEGENYIAETVITIEPQEE